MEGSGGIHCQYMNVEDEILNFYRRHIPARHSFLDVKSMTCNVTFECAKLGSPRPASAAKVR